MNAQSSAMQSALQTMMAQRLRDQAAAQQRPAQSATPADEQRMMQMQQSVTQPQQPSPDALMAAQMQRARDMNMAAQQQAQPQSQPEVGAGVQGAADIDARMRQMQGAMSAPGAGGMSSGGGMIGPASMPNTGQIGPASMPEVGGSVSSQAAPGAVDLRQDLMQSISAQQGARTAPGGAAMPSAAPQRPPMGMPPPARSTMPQQRPSMGMARPPARPLGR